MSRTTRRRRTLLNRRRGGDPRPRYRGTWKDLGGLTAITPSITVARNNLDITGATSDATGLIITKTGAFAGLTWRPSDTVWVSSGSGATPGYYEVNTGGTNNDDQVTLLDSVGSSASGLVLRYGACPVHVMVHAGDTQTVGHSGSPFDELEYRWDFGDPSDTRVYSVRNIDSGAQENVRYNDGQYGPMGCYTYVSPGSYTLTLSVRGWNGASYIEGETTVTVEIDAWPVSANSRLWIDGDDGSDANDGSDPHGFGITDGAYDNTTGSFTFTSTAETVSFTAEGFSNFEQADQCPDWVFLSSGTGGAFTPTLAKIVAKVSATEFTLESGLFSDDVSAIVTGTGPKQTFAAAIAHTASAENRRCLFKRGATYDHTAAWAGQDGCGLFDYGSGDLPVLNATTDVRTVQCSGSRNAITLRNLHFIQALGATSSTKGPIAFTGATSGASDVLLYGLRFTGAFGAGVTNFSSANGFEINRACFWEIHKDVSNAAGSSGMLFCAYESWAAVMGGYFAGGYIDPPNNLTHQIYLAQKSYDGTGVAGLVRGLRFGPSNETNFGLNWNVNNNLNDTDDVRTKYCLVEGCDFEHGLAGLELSNSGFAGNNGQRTRATDVIVENCCFHAGDGTAGTLGSVLLTIERVTLRDCRYWNSNLMNALYGTMSDHQFQIYRNKSYIADGTGIVLDVTATQAGCDFSHNEIWIAVAEANTDYAVSFANTSSTNWTLIGNKYYAPLAVVGPFWNLTDTVAASLSTFNTSLGASDTIESLDWSNPANGVFL